MKEEPTSKEQRDYIRSGKSSAERREAEAALRTSQAQLAGIIGSAMDAIITIDSQQRVILFNAAAERMFDCSADEALGQPIERFIPDRFRGPHRQHVHKFGETNVTRRSMGHLGDIYGLRPSGEEFPIEASISQIEANGEKLFTVILRDITERMKSEERLREQANLLDHAQDAILVRNLENRILYWNKSAERIYGWKADEVIGKDVREVLYKERPAFLQFEQACSDVMEKGEWIGELRQAARGGKEIISYSHWTLLRDSDGKPKSILSINTNVTEKKKLEAQFLRAQRLESLGTLAGGIAHDLNNILAPILMSVQLLQMRLKDADSRELLKALQVNAERGADMVKQVLLFARGADGEQTMLQPKHLIKEILKILRDTLPKSIDLRFSMPEDISLIRGDATQIHQVLMNLCVNARDAMPEGGKLTIRIENVCLDENYARMHLEAKPGRFVAITVSDTGTGIPPEVIHKIFEPFFTTKAHGKGTGLGLSTVLGIARGHGGFVDVYSEVGKGTQFKIFLPAIEVEESKIAEEVLNLPTGHGELILVVDDEASIREITKSTLKAFGYSVLTASDGTEAVALYAQNKDKVEMVLTDMMMPYMDGPATIRALQRIDPHVKIIASSGLSENGRAAEAAGIGVNKFLSKPYTAEKLLRAIAELLNAD
jgi:two-component system, cell cycle sensor histidine kinase and response regulator CckA